MGLKRGQQLSQLELKVYSALLCFRPAQLAELLKKVLLIRRKILLSKTGLLYWTDPVSVFGAHLLANGIHEPNLTDLISAFLRPNDTFVDVGANEGYFSILAASIVKHGQVHAIEPQSRLQPILEENVRLNGQAGIVKIHNVALSNGHSEVELFLRPSTNSGASSFFRHWQFGSARERVQATTLDDLFSHNVFGRVRFVKVDCEGAESLVVAGGHKTLEQQVIDYIDLEYHPAICGSDVCFATHQYLRKVGYRLAHVAGQPIYYLVGLEPELGSMGELRLDCEWNT